MPRDPAMWCDTRLDQHLAEQARAMALRTCAIMAALMVWLVVVTVSAAVL